MTLLGAKWPTGSDLLVRLNHRPVKYVIPLIDQSMPWWYRRDHTDERHSRVSYGFYVHWSESIDRLPIRLLGFVAIIPFHPHLINTLLILLLFLTRGEIVSRRLQQGANRYVGETVGGDIVGGECVRGRDVLLPYIQYHNTIYIHHQNKAFT